MYVSMQAMETLQVFLALIYTSFNTLNCYLFFQVHVFLKKYPGAWQKDFPFCELKISLPESYLVIYTNSEHSQKLKLSRKHSLFQEQNI